MPPRASHRNTLAAAGALAGLLWLARPAAAQVQDQTTTFRTRADVVQLDVTVLDEHGTPVRDLTAADFTILDDGVARPLAGFLRVDVPGWPADAPAWMRETPPDVATNHAPARRAVILLFDDCFTAWDADNGLRAQSVALAAIDGLGPGEPAAVVYTFNRRGGQEFTTDRARLREAVRNFRPTGLGSKSPAGTVLSASTPTFGLTMPSALHVPSGACPGNRNMFDALRNAGDVLREWPGTRKIVVMLSPGRMRGDVDNFSRLSESDDLRRTFTALQASNATVYQYDPSGLRIGAPAQEDFGTFPDATGGWAVMNTNDPADLVPRMYLENSAYYLLGFLPPDGVRAGSFRRVRVRVNRPGLRVTTRAGYYAPSRGASAAARAPASSIDRALTAGVPSAEVPLTLSVTPVATEGKPGAAIAVVARVDQPVPPGTTLEMVTTAFGDDWKEAASQQQRFSLPDGGDPMSSLELGARLDLAPGRYEVRVAVAGADGDKVGSVYTSVVVPAFAKVPLSLSGVVVEAGSEGAAVPPGLTAILPMRLTAGRVFAPDEHATVLVRVYQGQGERLRPVRIAARIVDAGDRTVFTADRDLPATEFDTGHQADYRLLLPLDRLTAGEHLLTIEASAGEATARRDLRFTVQR